MTTQFMMPKDHPFRYTQKELRAVSLGFVGEAAEEFASLDNDTAVQVLTAKYRLLGMDARDAEEAAKEFETPADYYKRLADDDRSFDRMFRNIKGP